MEAPGAPKCGCPSNILFAASSDSAWTIEYPPMCPWQGAPSMSVESPSGAPMSTSAAPACLAQFAHASMIGFRCSGGTFIICSLLDIVER